MAYLLQAYWNLKKMHLCSQDGWNIWENHKVLQWSTHRLQAVLNVGPSGGRHGDHKDSTMELKIWAKGCKAMEFG